MLEIELLGTVITEKIEELMDKINDIPGTNFSLDDIDLYAITFYNIDNISPCFENQFSLVTSSGIEYIVVARYDELKNTIRGKRLAPNFN